ncbi:MAG: sigma-70 family RNA polymerase sigma factor [Phycisphaerae bacterium]|nr:sigma-70 family RNA polymerase sigma factor [Phycisphaerae bacterium]
MNSGHDKNKSCSTETLDKPSELKRAHKPESHKHDNVNCCHPLGQCTDCPIAEDCTEKELVEACRRGYRQAQSQLYETYHQRIVSLMMRMTGGDRDESFDLCQQAFIRVLDRIGDFRGESALGTWIHRVAVNEALQHMRRKKRYQRITETIAEDPRRSDSVTEDPSRSMDVRDALSQLPDRMRKMVRLRYEKGLDYAEIADVLGVKQGTVASGLNRARRQLRHLLQ